MSKSGLFNGPSSCPRPCPAALSLVMGGANRHDSKLLGPILDLLMPERPAHQQCPQHLCADAGYKGRPCMDTIQARGYQSHVKQRREEAEQIKVTPGAKARRWVVERTHSWLNRGRKLLVGFETPRRPV